MNKSENLALMARPDTSGQPEQLALPLPVESKLLLTELQTKQQANHEAVCSAARLDAALYFAIVTQRFPDAGYSSLKEVTIPQLKECRPLFEAHPEYNTAPATVPHPELLVNYVARAIAEFAAQPDRPPSRPPRAYKPWTWQRRVNTAASKLRERFAKRYSIGELWIDQAQVKILENPWRYGCCPLPSEGSCFIPDPALILTGQKARALEVELRAGEPHALS